MKRTDRLKEIEKVWKRSHRHEYFDGVIPWEEIQWEPFTVKGEPQEKFEFPEVPKQLNKAGRFMHIWGEHEEASGWIEWDWALLRGLYTWYLLPEDCNAPFFVNEAALAFCIPDVSWADNAVLLFQHPDSVLLGMEHMDAEMEAQEAAIKAWFLTSLPASPMKDGPTFIDKREALAWLSK